MIELYRRVIHLYGGMGLVTNALVVLAVFLISTAAAVAVVVWMPVDHFTRPPGQDALARQHPVLGFTGHLAKNLLGLLIVPLGVVMAIPGVPGPGLVFILIGLNLLDFPGKRRLERRLLTVPTVLRFLNRVRRRFGKAPLVI